MYAQQTVLTAAQYRLSRATATQTTRSADKSARPADRQCAKQLAVCCGGALRDNLTSFVQQSHQLRQCHRCLTATAKVIATRHAARVYSVGSAAAARRVEDIICGVDKAEET